jgi:hypothetical protein
MKIERQMRSDLDVASIINSRVRLITILGFRTGTENDGSFALAACSINLRLSRFLK